MRFGPSLATDAAGAYLAHTIRLPGGALKKGRLLTESDIARLKDAGIETIQVARLEPGDIHEDAAACRLAAALVGPGLKASAAFTGRVNLIATTGGVLKVDADRINRINAIHESVTVATMPAFEPLAERQMAATIKIIPFAAPEDAIATAEAIAQESDGPALTLHGYRPFKAALIQSTLPNVKSSVLDKTVDVTRARIEALGGTLAGEWRCDHDAAAIASTITQADALGADLMLIAGASAIVDRADALPAGVEAAGGSVLHFGMPVDPGNLIMVGQRNSRPIYGLPGCARSPKMNGFDWVLQRFAAGVAVTSRDIQLMGVGGLLAEIGIRPLPRDQAPRQATTAPTAPNVAAMVLAAGQSRRMGVANKLLEPVAGKAMVARAVEAALAADVASVTVITGHESERIQQELAAYDLRFVHNPNFAIGLSASLQAAAKAAPDSADAIVILLGDMPGVTAAHIDNLIAAFNPLEGRAIVVPTRDGKRGNPVLWAARFLPEMADLKGDVGAKPLIGPNEDVLVEVEMGDSAILVDVDTPEALAQIRAETAAE
ncbi:MAG: NTP transferase domain-containing protein [Alphaproteobacteria bacterium]